MPFAFDTTYARLPDRLWARVDPTPVPSPRILAFNEELAAVLGLAPDELAAVELVEILAGNRIPAGSEPIALAYAGHQFGNFVPQLGDGRAILLGEVVGGDGRRYDVQLKGPGRTPFSRGGDGRAAIGPVLREFVMSEAMVALGVPTTRALAAVATGASVLRDQPLPGAVLTRVAASHLRIGTLQFLAARADVEGLRGLVEYALARHYPTVDRSEGAALALLDAVVGRQAELVASWLGVGFVHGVMNTDNTSISGETIDYGPCAFLDAYDPRRSFSSIDHHGRYAFANQPRIAQWNLARLAETLIPLVEDGDSRAIEILTRRIETWGSRFDDAYMVVMRRKLGFTAVRPGDEGLLAELLAAMAANRADYTLTFRRLAEVAAGGSTEAWLAGFADSSAAREWIPRWRARLAEEDGAGQPGGGEATAARMRAVNPAFIPRNHQIEAMIAAATAGDLGPLQRLRRVLARPYDDQPAEADLAVPPGDEQWGYRTFCGT